MNRQRRALVTGAGRGIGKKIAERLAEDGYHVIFADIDRQAAQSAVEALCAAGCVAEAVALDVSNEGAVREVFAGLGALDILVNNAAVFRDGPWQELTREEFCRVFDVNVYGAFLTTRHAVASMPNGGRIINISSRAYLGAVNQLEYAASKGALVTMTRSLALELLPRGILVNAIAPGLVHTPLLEAMSEERRQRQLSLQPMGKAISTEEIAHVASFLASPALSSVTGQVLMVDGGKSLGH